MIRFAVWGTGKRAKRFVDFYGTGDIEVFIDNDEARQGEFLGRPVVGFGEYLRAHGNCIIVITPIQAESIEKQVADAGISFYFLYGDEPAETMGQGNPGYLREIPNEKDMCYIVYGCSCYGLWLYGKIREKGLCCDLIVDSGYTSDDTGILEEALNSPVHTDAERFPTGEEKYGIYLTAMRRKQDFLESLSAEATEDRYDMMRHYHRNAGIQGFRGKHEGERCFIVATGPSLLMRDLDTLHRNGGTCFSMNRIYLAFRDTEWRPDYYVVEDALGMEQFGDDMVNVEAGGLFFADTDREFLKRELPGNAHIFHYAQAKDADGNIKFSDDAARGIYTGAAVVYTCMQFAAYMGFKEIILLGVDFSYKGESESKGNHFYHIEGENVRSNPFRKDYTLAAYESAERYSRDRGIRILNATRGGYAGSIRESGLRQPVLKRKMPDFPGRGI